MRHNRVRKGREAMQRRQRRAALNCTLRGIAVAAYLAAGGVKPVGQYYKG